MTEFTLYIGNKNYSSWSLRGWLPLMLSGASFSEVKLPLDTPAFYTALAGISPTVCVPTLVHHCVDGDITIWDSLAITDYLARRYPVANLWPDTDAAYAFARSVTAEMHAGFMALRAAAPMNMRAAFHGLGLSDAVAKDVQRIEAIWDEARTRFGGGGPFLFGSEMNAVDAFFAPVVSRFKTYDVALSDGGRAYCAAVIDHPAMQAWHREAVLETARVAADEIDPATKILGLSGASGQ